MDKYHYVVDGTRRTYNRNEAMLWAGGDDSRIHFYFLDDIWNRMNLCEEPLMDIETLGVRRCHEIRDRYDYICLWLSAGYDSQTALRYFIKAGVRIDEIATRWKHNCFDDPETKIVEQTAELYRRYYNNNLIFSQVDVGPQMNQQIYQHHKEHWFLEAGGSLKFLKTSPYYTYTWHDRAKRNRDQRVWRRADVVGKEKPRLDLKHGHWYLWMPDVILQDTIATTNEDFYISPTLPELFIKQVYLAIRYFESLDGINHSLVHQIQRNDTRYYRDWNLAMGRVAVHGENIMNGSVKALTTNEPFSFESQRLLKHFETTHPEIVTFYRQGLDMLQTALPSVDIHNFFLPSTAWPICPFGRFRSQPAATADGSLIPASVTA